MRHFLLFVLFCAIACNQQAQDENNTLTIGKTILNKPTETKYAEEAAYPIIRAKLDIVKIDSVANIAKGTNEKSASFIKKRLKALVGNYLKEKCEANSLNYPPKFILFRFFKYEEEFEVWAGNSRSDSLRLLFTFGICAVDNVPGTKLAQGDGKTPEGFYNSPLYYGSSADFMWIKLNNSEISTYGSAGYGSSFKMCLNYPNSLDRLLTKKVLKHNNPGSAICIHGNCVSIGCISFVNKDYLPVYLAAMGHNTNSYGSIKIHILPFRFNNIGEKQKKELAKEVSRMTEKQVVEIWDNLEEAYTLFNETHKAVNFKINKDKYTFTTY